MGNEQSLKIKIPALIEQEDESDKVVTTLLVGPGNCKIFGSYVYKRIIRGEKVNDIDCISEDYNLTCENLRKVMNAKYKHEISPDESIMDYTRLYVNKISINLISENEYLLNPLTKITTFINVIQLTKDGLVHKDATYYISKIETIYFVINNLQNNIYFPWENMTENDQDYFKDFYQLSAEKAAKFGFYRTNSWKKYLESFIYSLTKN